MLTDRDTECDKGPCGKDVKNLFYDIQPAPENKEQQPEYKINKQAHIPAVSSVDRVLLFRGKEKGKQIGHHKGRHPHSGPLVPRRLGA